MTGRKIRAWVDGLAGVAATAVVLVTVAGGLISEPVARARLTGPFYGTVLTLGVLSLITTGRSRWRPVAVLLPVFWIAFAAWAPSALDRAPNPIEARFELTRMWPCAALSLAALGLSRGGFAGLTGLRAGWFAGLAGSVALAVYEFTTSQHLFISARNPWRFGDGLVAVGTYINPNNFAAALVAMITGSLALAATLRSRWLLAPAWIVITAGCVTVALTQSRSGVIALALVLALEVRRRSGERLAAGPARLRDRLRALPDVARGVLWGLAAAAAVLLIVSFTLPSLAQRNPLAPAIAAQFNDETARSDSLRMDLLAAAWRYLAGSGWLGSGAGSFEPLLRSDPSPGTSKLTNLHNTFMELTSQYGVHIGALFALILAGVIAAILHPRTGLGHATRTARYEACGQLIALTAMGISASSALHVPSWWVMVAAACACAWQVSAAGASARRAARQAARQPDDPAVAGQPGVSGPGSSAEQPAGQG